MRLAARVLVCVLASIGCGVPVSSSVQSPGAALSAPSPSSPPSTNVATLEPVGELACKPDAKTCGRLDAIVFVHGIYGSRETFTNARTHFDWPKEFPRVLPVDDEQRRMDVYRLNYLTTMVTWAKGKNPSFLELARAVEVAMKPLRQRQYRSIGFIVHSLGGNVISTYLLQVKLARDHAGLAQHAYMITLGTPVLGSQVADIALTIKSRLGMSDDLLNSLKRDNIYLQMLNEMKEWQAGKAARLGCRALDLHVGVEEKFIGPIIVVNRDSSALPLLALASSPIVGFRLNHLEISKPADAKSEVYTWAMGRVEEELRRLTGWELAHEQAQPAFRLCDRVMFEPEI